MQSLREELKYKLEVKEKLDEVNFTFELDNATAFTAPVRTTSSRYSEFFYVKGMPFFVGIQNGRYLGVYLFMHNLGDDSDWFVYANFKVSILSQFKYYDDITEQTDVVFSKSRYDFFKGWDFFTRTDDVRGNANYIDNDDKIKVKIHLKVNKIVRKSVSFKDMMRKLEKSNFSTLNLGNPRPWF